ncbi:MAG: hypothetical protein IT383_27405 [Deltaproteobacteria bacterium]|nr:hypothetical protein [Deltaproteobacteria bacterium]
MIGLDFDRVVRTAVGTFGDQGRINGAAATILTVSFLASVILEWKKQLRGERPDWASPITRLLLFGLLLGFYSVVARSVIELVSSLGDLQSIDPASAKKSVFAARAEAFSSALGDDASFSLSNLELSAAALINSLLDVATYLTFTLAAACVFILKVIQKVMLNVLLTLGPIMIAFASIPGLTQGYLAAWLLGLIEVTAWGVTAKIFLAMLITSERGTTVNPNLTQNLAEHMVFNLVYATSFLVIPVATSSILRGGAAHLAQGAIGSAKRAASAGGAMASAGAASLTHKLTPDHASRANRANDAPSGVAPSVERAGDHAADPNARRDAFARDAAIRKHERAGGEGGGP